MQTILNIPPGIYGDDTSYSKAGRWLDGNNVRFWLGQAQLIGGWERLSTEYLVGVCRGALPWTDNNSALNLGFGTHTALQVWRDELFDVTPRLERPASILSDPFTVADGDATVTVEHINHGLETGDVVVGSGADAVGRIRPAGEITIPKPIAAETGFAWQFTTTVNPAVQELRLYEDGIPLGPGDQLHADIRNIGGGRYSHWTSGGTHLVYFSTSDNSDPNTNGRAYTLRPAYEVTVTDEDHYTIEHTAAADLAKTLGSNPFTVKNGSAWVTVAEAGHGLPMDLEVTISGAAAVGGITPNGKFFVEVVDANTWKFLYVDEDGAAHNATSDQTGGGAAVVVTVPATGGGDAVSLAPDLPFTAGSIDGAGGAGFGTGTWSTGPFSAPSEEVYFPRTWTLSTLGQWLIANPRGGTIYAWQNDAETPAEPVAGAPRQVLCGLVGPNDELFAFGCNEEVSGVFNPLCIRHSGLRDELGPNHTEWRSRPETTAREYVLPGGGRIVSARLAGQYLLVWTTHGLFLGQFVGAPEQIWRFTPVARDCGLIGPNAAVVVDGALAFWMAPDLQLRQYALGGRPSVLPCVILKDMTDNLAKVQGDKIVASALSSFGEIRFDYPDVRDNGGTENSRYVAASVAMLQTSPESAWYRGRMARTAMVDAGPAGFPIGVQPAAVAGQALTIEHDGGTATETLEALDVDLSQGAWSGGYVQSIATGLLSADLTFSAPFWLSCVRASAGLAKNPDGTLSSFAADTLRRTGRGLLIEPAATNIIPSSEATYTTVFAASGASGTSAPTNAPFAASAWTDMIHPGPVTSAYYYFDLPVAASTRYAMSVFVHMVDGSQPILATGFSTADGHFTFVVQGGVALTFEDIQYEPFSGNVWRVSATFVTKPAALPGPAYLGISRNPLHTVGTMKFTGLQLEVGRSASSYIATSGAPVTRAADQVRADFAFAVPYFHEKGTSADGGPIAWHIESADRFLDVNRTADVRTVWPDFSVQAGAATVTVTSRLKPQGDERSKGPVAMAPGQDKVDYRLSGRLFRFRLAGDSSPAAMRLGRITVDWAPKGLR